MSVDCLLRNLFILASLVFPVCSLFFVFNLFLFYRSLSHFLSFNFHSSFLSLSHCRKSEEGLQSEPPHLSPHSTLHNHPDYPPMRENKIQQKPKGNPSILGAAGTQKHTQPFNISGDLELYNPAAVEYCCRQGFLSSFFLAVFNHQAPSFHFFYFSFQPFNLLSLRLLMYFLYSLLKTESQHVSHRC